jgi:hypothetical protein
MLQTAMPKGITIKKVIALVNAMAKLHNFCIDQVDGREEGGNDQEMDEPTPQDRFHIMESTIGFVELEQNEEGNSNLVVPRELLESGHHFDEVPRHQRMYRRGEEGQLADKLLPREKLHDKVVDSHKVRPSTKGGSSRPSTKGGSSR